MMIDYEAEYNNRARVPDHEEIFARWRHDADAYRAEANREGRAELAIPYGESARQIVDIFRPANGDANAPVALFIHGGYWRSLEPALFSHLARALNTHGYTVALAGYDLAPQVRISTIVDQLRRACLFVWRRLGCKLFVYGHSAGGHLAACMVGTDWRDHDADAPRDLTRVGYALSCVSDLMPLLNTSMNADLRLDAREAAQVSPVRWPVSADRVLHIGVGALESSEFLRQSREIADAWGKRGAGTRYEELAGLNHFTAVDPFADAGSAQTQEIVGLIKRIR
jgi:arylformamidase